MGSERLKRFNNDAADSSTLYRQISLAAVLATLTATVLIVVQTRLDVSPTFPSAAVNCHGAEISGSVFGSAVFPPPTFDGYVAALSTIIFAYGGLSTFPTVQADMEDKGRFKYAAVAALTSK